MEPLWTTSLIKTLLWRPKNLLIIEKWRGMAENLTRYPIRLNCLDKTACHMSQCCQVAPVMLNIQAIGTTVKRSTIKITLEIRTKNPYFPRLSTSPLLFKSLSKIILTSERRFIEFQFFSHKPPRCIVGLCECPFEIW